MEKVISFLVYSWGFIVGCVFNLSGNIISSVFRQKGTNRMKWYGFFAIFVVSTVFCNLLLAIRMAAPEEDLVVKTFSLPERSLQISDRPESAVLSAETMPKQPLLLFFFASWCRPCSLKRRSSPSCPNAMTFLLSESRYGTPRKN